MFFLKKDPINPFREYNFPLAFSKSKKFYVPKYNVYNSDFFKEYGVMDWVPNCKIESNNTINLTVYNPHNIGVKIFLEGITEDGDFISETKTVRFAN